MIKNPVLGGLGATAGITFFQTFFGKLVAVALIAGSVIFLFMLITGAIQWISSGGDKQALENAKSKVTNAIVGIIILFAIFAVINFVSSFFGNIPILNAPLNPVTP
jgi:xanthine/uracil permease